MIQNYHFRSETREGVIYTVSLMEGKPVCNCPSATFHGTYPCRHILLIKNGLAGVAINEEPKLIPCAVRNVRVDNGDILIPKFHNIWKTVQIIYELRKLGVSKKSCNDYFGADYGSDEEIKDILTKIGYFKPKVIEVTPPPTFQTISKEKAKEILAEIEPEIEKIVQSAALIEFERFGFENMDCVKKHVHKIPTKNYRHKVPAFALIGGVR